MNEYLASPVTPIVIAVLAITLSIAALLKVRSNKKKRAIEAERRAREAVAAERRRAKEEADARAAKARLDQQRSKTIRGLEAAREKLRGKPKSIPAPGRRGFRKDSPSTTTYGESRRYDPTTDSLLMNASLFGFIAPDATPERSNDDNSSRDTGSSHGNGGSSSGSGWGSDSGGGGSWGGSDSGSSGSSSDSGSSSGGDSGGGGGGGGCD